MRPSFPFALVLAACSNGAATPPPDAAAPADVADVARAEDAPASQDVAAPLDASGARCSFNRDCPEAERCECEESSGCRCAVGARGAGRAGVDRCESGNDCASALCVEANGGVSLCSDPCTGASDCPAALPRCLSVPTVGRFCARDPSASGDAAVDAPPGCAGECARTTLMGTFGARRGGFDRAQHGNDEGGRLRVEAHQGGDPACPREGSPTPRRTLVITGVRATADATPQTEADGVVVSLLDFTSELTSAPVLRASAARVVPRAFARGGHVSFELTATFPGGTITGGVFAPHCDSLD